MTLQIAPNWNQLCSVIRRLLWNEDKSFSISDICAQDREVMLLQYNLVFFSVLVKHLARAAHFRGELAGVQVERLLRRKKNSQKEDDFKKSLSEMSTLSFGRIHDNSTVTQIQDSQRLQVMDLHATRNK